MVAVKVSSFFSQNGGPEKQKDRTLNRGEKQAVTVFDHCLHSELMTVIKARG